MRNFFKTFGIIAMIAIIGFTMTACPEEDENGNGGNGDNGGGGGKTFFGDKLELSGQVYTYTLDGGIPVFTKFEGDLALKSDTVMGASGEIKGGILTYTVGVPSAEILYAITEFKKMIGGDSYKDWAISDESAKYNVLQYIPVTGSDSYSYVLKADMTGNMSSSTGSRTQEQMLFMYFDKPVTITAKGSTETRSESSTWSYNDLNLSLKEGWNTVYYKMSESSTNGVSTTTVSLSVSNPDLKWVLQGGGNDDSEEQGSSS